MTTTIIGAYCAAPADAAAEEEWYRTLADRPEIGGLELPFSDTLHPAGVDRLAALLPAHWRNVVTDIPGTARRALADGRYGLASHDTDGRRAALADARRLRDEVTALGSRVVAVELHSAPSGGDAARFAASLTEIAGWDWGEVVLCVEHVDAAGGRTPEKGYLRIEDEILAVRRASEESGRRLVQSVNWGRSVIEGHSIQTPLDHIDALRDAGTLGGLMLSGAAATGPDAWKDVHCGMTADDPHSLLDEDAAHATQDAAGDTSLLFRGVKMRPSPALPDTASHRERLGAMLRGLSTLR